MDTQDLQRLKVRYDIVGNDASLNRALEMAVMAAPNDLPVLITGESGVGKETIPQIIHQFSRRSKGKYLAVNCGAIPEGTINAELFGHEKGAYTGAIGERKGYFEEADGGTLFLDEIGELPKETQSMLLRVIQSGEYIKVGSSKVEKTNVRVIAATNVNLIYAISTGKFREDLYYRLNGIQINMPSLRERKDDIFLLFRKFSADFSEKYSLRKIALSHEAITLLTSYRWPGNIRQLKNVSESLTALESLPMAPAAERIEIDARTLQKYIPQEHDSLIPAMAGPAMRGGSMNDSDKQMIIKALLDLKQEMDMLKEELESLRSSHAASSVHIPNQAPRILETTRSDGASHSPIVEPDVADDEPISIRKASDDLIERALAKHGGNIKDAAVELGISERTIYRKLARMRKK